MVFGHVGSLKIDAYLLAEQLALVPAREHVITDSERLMQLELDIVGRGDRGYSCKKNGRVTWKNMQGHDTAAVLATLWLRVTMYQRKKLTKNIDPKIQHVLTTVVQWRSQLKAAAETLLTSHQAL